MIFFTCFLTDKADVRLSSEHSSCEWLPVKDAGDVVHHKMRRAYERLVGLELTGRFGL